MLISFVIPVYNVEKYINECIDSILNQQFTDYEIILVDDGSKDNSGAICDTYSDKYDFISVVHKKNGGLSDARNIGIQNAKGDYILFVDSDDYIGQDSLNKIVDIVKKQNNVVDLVFLEALKVFPDKSIIPLGDGYVGDLINGKSKKEVMLHLASLPKYPGSACTKLIKRSLIVNNNLYFEKGLLSEDIDWTIGLLMKAESFAYCDADYYYYRQNRVGSITNTANIKNVRDLLYIIKKWSRNDKNNLYQEQINSFLAYEYMIALYFYSSLEKKDKQVLKKDIQELRWIFNYASSRKTKLFAMLSRILGITVTSWLVKQLRR